MKQHLEALRASRPGYEVVAFGDAAAQIVLRASHEKSYRREHLDRLCEKAASCFQMLKNAAKTWDLEDPLIEAVLLQDAKVAVFVKQDADASEFLCLVSREPLSMEAILSDAHNTLAKISPDVR